MPNETTGERLLARRYRLLTQVGHGGMGTVWQAHDEVLGRDVAVKEVILPHGLTDEERAIQYKRTFREARTAARLGHPGVVTVYDVVEEDGRPWIVMELIRARSLDQVIKQEGPLPARRAAEVGRQMLAALHAAHEAGVLHRDVKPSNVLLARGDRAVLTDFGIATAQGDATLTQTGLVMGSPAYIAPERARGRTAGPSSDLWSLGVTLYAMIDGKSPFERSEPMAALVAIISEEPPPTPQAGDLSTVIEGLLRKDPDQRMDAHEAGPLLDEIVREHSIDTQRTRALPVLPEEIEPAATAADADAADAAGAALTIDAPLSDALLSDAPSGEPLSERPPDATAPDHRAPRRAPDRSRGQSARPLEPVRLGEPTAPAATPAGPAGPAGPPRPLGERWNDFLDWARQRNRGVVIVAAIVLVALVGIGAAALAAGGGDKKPARKSGQNAPARTGTTAPTTPASGQPVDEGVPDGFREHKDRTGFSLAVPDDWKGPGRRGYSSSSVFFDSPDGDSYIQIDQTSSPNSSALRDWEKAEGGAAGRFDGYKKVRIGPVTQGAPLADPTGAKAADWEFTFGGGDGRKHALNRGLVMNGRGYAIFIVAPDKDWDDAMKDLAPVFETFKPAPR